MVILFLSLISEKLGLKGHSCLERRGLRHGSSHDLFSCWEDFHILSMFVSTLGQEGRNPSLQVREGARPSSPSQVVTRPSLKKPCPSPRTSTYSFTFSPTFAHFLHAPLLTREFSRASEEPLTSQNETESPLKRLWKRISPENKGSLRSTQPSLPQNTSVETQGGPVEEPEAVLDTPQLDSRSEVCFPKPQI